MVKRSKTSSISENDDESTILNENGKRTAETQSVDGKKQKRIKNLYRQPTVRELNRLQETENLFNSNLFRLQIEEILEEVKVKEKTVKRFTEWFNTFKEHLLTIPEDNTEYNLSEDLLFKYLNVKSPISNELNTKCMFKFNKFQDVKIVGSYSIGSTINSQLIIDAQITIPAEAYTKNDSINYKYHKKRAAYLACIASHLQKLDIIEECKYAYLNGNNTKPVLDIKPKGKLGNVLKLRINLICESEAFKLHRFSPLRNNLRVSWLFKNENVDSTVEVEPPTPFYNSSILSDSTDDVNQQFLKEVFTDHENLKQAVVLLKIWIRQRKLRVSGYVISMFVAYLVQIKRINNIMSSYQIIRNVWIALKTSEWDTKGVSLCKGTGTTPTLEEFKQYFPVVFIDKTGYYNICWDMHKGTYNALRRESGIAINMLDDAKINSFIPLFMTPVNHLMQFDHIIRFKNPAKVQENILDRVPKESRVNYGLNETAPVVETIYALLTRGLGDRVKLILQLVEDDCSWPINVKAEKKRDIDVAFGLILNSEKVINIVDRGPPANLPESEEFRLFWGDKSELRRFQDGSITEACVWSAEGMASRRALPKQIVNYLMNFKYGIPSSQIYHVCDQLDSLLVCKSAGEHIEERSLEVLRSFDELRRDLRTLDQLPLEISAVHGVSSVFSYSDPQPSGASPPIPNARRRGDSAILKDVKGARVPPYTPATTAILELGHSGKWPGDLTAFRCLKAAFYVQLADRITKQFSIPSQPHPGHLDLLKAGRVFRLKIAHPKELVLMQRRKDEGVVRHCHNDDSLAMQRDCLLLPRLRGALHGLQQRHGSFGPASCFLIRWLNSHLINQHHFPAVVAELLVAASFKPESLEPPVQPLALFLRALRLIVNTDWHKEMLVVDVNDDMTREEISELEKKFNEREDNTPYMYIVTPYDGDLPSIWTRNAPTKEVVVRVQSLARASLAYFESALLKNFKDNILSAFVPSLSGYDALIHLEASALIYPKEVVEGAIGSVAKKKEVLEEFLPVVEFDPVAKYLEELRSAFDQFALFFHDTYGGRIIAVLWRPDLDVAKDFHIANPIALKQIEVEGETKYVVNKEALLQDFKIMGAGIVREITVT